MLLISSAGPLDPTAVWGSQFQPGWLKKAQQLSFGGNEALSQSMTGGHGPAKWMIKKSLQSKNGPPREFTWLNWVGAPEYFQDEQDRLQRLIVWVCWPYTCWVLRTLPLFWRCSQAQSVLCMLCCQSSTGSIELGPRYWILFLCSTRNPSRLYCFVITISSCFKEIWEYFFFS